MHGPFWRKKKKEFLFLFLLSTDYLSSNLSTLEQGIINITNISLSLLSRVGFANYAFLLNPI